MKRETESEKDNNKIKRLEGRENWRGRRKKYRSQRRKERSRDGVGRRKESEANWGVNEKEKGR